MLRAALFLCLLVFLGFFLGTCGSSQEAPPEPAAPALAPSESEAGAPDEEAAAQQAREALPGESESRQPEEAGAMKEQAGTPAGEREPQAAMAGEKGQAMAAMTPQAGQSAAEPRMERPPQPPPPQDERIPFEKAFPEEARKIRPVRIGVLSSPNRPQAGRQVALILGTYQRPRLERILGRKVKIAFVSQSSKPHRAQTVIFYRPDFLKAAIQAASVMPGAQVVEPMTEPDLSREGTDIIIYIGKDTR